MKPSPDEVRQQLARILRSRAFLDADRARKFLAHVVECTLDGRGEEIKETTIALEVLGRAPSFDPKIDPIVRVEAGRLRTRLDTYYEREGNQDRVRIELPKGGYTPRFTVQEQIRPIQEQVRERATRPARSILVLVVTCIGVALIGVMAGHFGWPTGTRTELRLSVLPAAGTEVRSSAISPDGRMVAFTAQSAQGLYLWVRSLDSLSPRSLPGTEGAAYPFWSPNSRSIAFFSMGKLERVDVSGGPVRTVCPVSVAFGGSWSSRGVMLFSERPSGRILKVSAEGGTPEPVTQLNGSHGEVAHLFPSFLPDGHHFLFSVLRTGADVPAVAVASIDGENPRVILDGDSGAVYVPPARTRPGGLLYSYRGALLYQPFDAERLRLSGTARTITDHVRRVLGRADFSAALNGTLAYQPGAAADQRFTWFDSSGKELRTIGVRNSVSSWSLSRDESRVVVQEQDTANGLPSIAVIDLEDGARFKVPSRGPQAFFPIWSPDGRELLFSQGSSLEMELVRFRLTALEGAAFDRSPDSKFPTDWSGEGRWIAYFRPAPNKPLTIWIADLQGRVADRPFSATEANEFGAYFSPELAAGGPRWIAYTSNESGRAEVFVRSFPAGDFKSQVSVGGGWLPHWQSDGRALFYLGLDGTLMRVRVQPGQEWRPNAPEPLFRTGILGPPGYPDVPSNVYAVSRDGQRFLLNEPAGGFSSSSITVQLTENP